MNQSPNVLSEKQGSVVITCLVIGTALATVLAAILSHALTERRLNSRHELRLEARNAAEAIAEYGFAQLRHKFDNRTSIGYDALEPGSADALRLPPAAHLGPQLKIAECSIIGGTIPPFPSSLTYLDPNDLDNEFDPLKGKMVRAREIALYAKATLRDPTGGPDLATYVGQMLQVRDAPLFAHAIFYNLDLEISPGPEMKIYGPVHTNGDLYVQGIDGIHFHDQVTTAGDVFYGWGTSDPEAHGSGYEALQQGPIKFADRDGDLVAMEISNGKRIDSKMGSSEVDPTFRSYASNRWHGNLQTQAHGIENYRPVAFPEYEPDDPSTIAYDPVNTGHTLIEPALPASTPECSAEVEKQKMANKAGLRFVWDAESGSMAAYDKDGSALDISQLEGSGPEFLWEVKENAMWDDRRKSRIDILDFNVGKLKALIESPDSSDAAKHIGGFNPDDDWNGIVYFETTSSSPSAEKRARLNHSGVRLWGGQTSAAGQGVPSRGADPGVTFATNNALYVKGHFNADGERHQEGSSQHSAIKKEVGEVPVALFGDSVTLLSNNWDDAYSIDKRSSWSSNKTVADHTEVAAAIVSGLIPSDAGDNDASSGGVHNFPRFLENWGGKDLFIRGSLVALYESEVDNSAWRIDYYNPPKRKWGFSELYELGAYPPGTPLIRDYRRLDFRDLTQVQYEAAVAALPW